MILDTPKFAFAGHLKPEMDARLFGCQIYEVSIAYHGRIYVVGKKLGWGNGVTALLHVPYGRFFDGP
jgi:hypothetical protein